MRIRTLPKNRLARSGRAIFAVIVCAVRAVQHIDAPERADEIAEQISVALGGKDIVRIEIGAVVGAHVGPGCVAVTVAPKPWSHT